MKRTIAAGLTLLMLVSGLCISGLKAIDKRLAEKGKP